MAGSHLRFDLTLDRFLDELTDAACRTASAKPAKTPLQIRMRKNLKSVLEKDMRVNKQCGSHIIGICACSQQLTPWSHEAQELETVDKSTSPPPPVSLMTNRP